MILCLPQTVPLLGMGSMLMEAHARIVELKDSKKMMMNGEDIRDYKGGKVDVCRKRLCGFVKVCVDFRWKLW